MIEELKNKIQRCIYMLYKNDSDLFSRDNYEVTISAKLSQYLFSEFNGYDVDCEYNRHIDAVKYSEEIAKNIRPDIVIHKRGTDKNNLVYIEIKKSQNMSNREADIKKLTIMTKGEYHYALGVFIDLAVDPQYTTLSYYVNGVRIE